MIKQCATLDPALSAHCQSDLAVPDLFDELYSRFSSAGDVFDISKMTPEKIQRAFTRGKLLLIYIVYQLAK